MAKKCFKLIERVTDEKPDKLPNLQPFLQNYQIALLSSLLDKNLLTQWQFDQCVEELQKQGAKIDSENKREAHADTER